MTREYGESVAFGKREVWTCCGADYCFDFLRLSGVALLGASARQSEEKGVQAARLISIASLQPLLVLHMRPIDPVVFREP